MVDQPSYPVVVSGSAIQDTLYAGLRLLSVLIGGGVAILALIGRHDLAGLVAYIHSDAFTPVAGALASLASAGYGLYRTYRKSRDAQKMAAVLPDSLAVQKGSPPNAS